MQYLRPFHGGQSATNRLIGGGHVSVNGTIIFIPDYPLYDGDLIQVGKSWRRVVGAA
jgi:ribosomal protein S4